MPPAVPAGKDGPRFVVEATRSPTAGARLPYLLMNSATQSSRRHRSAGFTLIEVMVVILILGLLATVVAQNVTGLFTESQDGKAKLDLKALHDATRYYQMTKGKLPESLSVLKEKDAKGVSYIDELPQDPWNNDYRLVVESPKNWKIISYGPDGSEGGGDDLSSVKEEEN